MSSSIKFIHRFRIVATLSAILLFALAFNTLVPFYNDRETAQVSATTTTENLTPGDTSISITADSSIVLPLIPNSNYGTFSSTTSTFTVAATNPGGYTLSLATRSNSGEDTTSLVNQDDTSSKFTTISGTVSTTAFSQDNATGAALNGKWGYKYYKGTDSSSDNGNFNEMTANSAISLDSVNTAATNTYTLGIGARAGLDLPAGTYSNTFVLTATANPISYTFNLKLNDGTANNFYTQVGSTYGTVASIYATAPTRDGYEFKGWCSTTTNDDTCSGTTYQPGADYTIDASSSATTATFYAMWKRSRVAMQDLTFDQCTTEGVTVYDNRNPEVTYTVKRITLNGVPTCWMMSNLKLPKTASITPDNSNVTSTYTALSSPGNWTSYSQNDYCKPYMAVANGEYYYNWPAATARTNTTTGSSSCSNDISNSVGDICPKGWRLPTNTETDNSTWLTNIATSGGLATTGLFHSGSPYNVGSDGRWWTSTRLNSSYAYYLSFDGSSAYSSNSHKYFGFSVRCMMNTIQDYTKAMCQEQASNGDVTVIDRRDGSDYTVRYINGACWMTQNLRITKSTGQADWTISSTGSNFTRVSTWNVHVSDLSAGNSYTEARSHVPTATDADTSGNKPMNTYTAEQIGVWYNYCAASAGQVCSQTKTNATQDICPENWHLPSYNTAPGAFSGMTGTVTLPGGTNNASYFNPIYGGNWNGGSLNTATTYGRWWSATAYSNYNQYYLYYYNGSLVTSYNNKSNGFYIRCTRTS